MKIDNNHGYLTNLNASELIKANGELGALELVSQQFEAQFLQTVLKQMRQASDVMADKDSPLSSQNDGMYRDWHDAELAGRLSQMQSSGLASVITKQLSAGLQSSAQPVASNKQQEFEPNSHTATVLPFESVNLGSTAMTNSKAMQQSALVLPVFEQSNKSR